MTFIKTLVHKAFRFLLVGVLTVLRHTDNPEAREKVCIVCNYPNGGNSVCGELHKMEHMNRERYRQSVEFWKELESNPQSKIDYMKMMGMNDEADYQQRKVKYLG